MLDPRWNTFLVLCETMNYTRAAERLCLTQPAVTHHIHYLEDHYGCRLFIYEGKILRLTEAGPEMPEDNRSPAYQQTQGRRSKITPSSPSLRGGTLKNPGAFLVPPQVERFLQEHPEANFSLTVDNTQTLLRSLESGRLDFVLLEGFFDRSRYDATLYRKEPFFGVCSPEHHFAGRTVAIEELDAERILIREPGSGTRTIFEDALRRHNRTLNRFSKTTTISDFSTIKSLVADGLGISFLYEVAVSKELDSGVLARFDLAETPMSGAFYFVCLKENLFAADWIHWME